MGLGGGRRGTNSLSHQMVWASLVASEWLEQREGRKTFLQHSHCVCAFSRPFWPQPLLEGCSSRPQAQLLPHIPVPVPLHLCPCYWSLLQRTRAMVPWRWPLPGLLLLRRGS